MNIYEGEDIYAVECYCWPRALKTIAELFMLV